MFFHDQYSSLLDGGAPPTQNSIAQRILIAIEQKNTVIFLPMFVLVFILVFVIVFDHL